MLLQLGFLSALFLLANIGSVQAAPANATTAAEANSMVVLFTQKSANVTLTFYRYPEGSEPRSLSADPLLHKRRGSNKVQCDFSNNLACV
jgi:hypothetical protein